MPDLTIPAASVGALLKERQQTLSVSESFCGGLLSGCLEAIPGASAYYVGGAVVYTRAAHKRVLQVPDSAMANMRASTEAYALLNTRTIREALSATWALSETGASGPSGRAITLESGSNDREANMWAFARAAFDLLEQCVREAG